MFYFSSYILISLIRELFTARRTHQQQRNARETLNVCGGSLLFCASESSVTSDEARMEKFL